jgi:hypothetical protein
MKSTILKLLFLSLSISSASAQYQSNKIFLIKKLPENLITIKKEDLTRFNSIFDHVHAPVELPLNLYKCDNILISTCEQVDNLRPLRQTLEQRSKQFLFGLRKNPLITVHSSNMITLDI